jgi:hypothetical protein
VRQGGGLRVVIGVAVQQAVGGEVGDLLAHKAQVEILAGNLALALTCTTGQQRKAYPTQSQS